MWPGTTPRARTSTCQQKDILSTLGTAVVNVVNVAEVEKCWGASPQGLPLRDYTDHMNSV